jgi:hypothetical protein
MSEIEHCDADAAEWLLPQSSAFGINAFLSFLIRLRFVFCRGLI